METLEAAGPWGMGVLHHFLLHAAGIASKNSRAVSFPTASSKLPKVMAWTEQAQTKISAKEAPLSIVSYLHIERNSIILRLPFILLLK